MPCIGFPYTDKLHRLTRRWTLLFSGFMTFPTNANNFLDVSKQEKGEKPNNKQTTRKSQEISLKKRIILTESMYTSSIQSAKVQCDLKQIRVYFLWQAVIN